MDHCISCPLLPLHPQLTLFRVHKHQISPEAHYWRQKFKLGDSAGGGGRQGRASACCRALLAPPHSLPGPATPSLSVSYTLRKWEIGGTGGCAGGASARSTFFRW